MLPKDDEEAFGLTLAPNTFFPSSFSLFSGAGEGEAAKGPKSRDVPGVLGFFAEEPKEANAPDPRPKADDAPAVGEDMLVVVKGGMLLKGLDLPCEDVSPPKRFAEGNARGVSVFGLSLLLLGLEVVNDSLPELAIQESVNSRHGREEATTYFDLRCHRLSIDAGSSVRVLESARSFAVH